MRINVKVKPGAKEECIEKTGETDYFVSVKELPIQGRANEAVLRALSDYFNLPKANFRIVSGFTSRNKIIEINT